MLQYVAMCRSVLQTAFELISLLIRGLSKNTQMLNRRVIPYTIKHCYSLQRTAKYQRHTATHCNTLQHTATRCNTLQHTTHCNISTTLAFEVVSLLIRVFSGKKYLSNTGMGWLRSVGPINYKSLLQDMVSFIGLFCKTDL